MDRVRASGQRLYDGIEREHRLLTASEVEAQFGEVAESW